MPKSKFSLSLLVTITLAVAAASAGHASPTEATVPGIALKGPCPGALVWVGDSKIMVSQRVAATNAGGCRYSGMHDTTLHDLGADLSSPRPTQVAIQPVGDPQYMHFIRVVARLQDSYVYHFVLVNGRPTA